MELQTAILATMTMTMAALAGCAGSGNGSGNGDGGGNPPGNKPLKVVTDTSACGSGVEPTRLEGDYMMQMSTEDKSLVTNMLFHFEDGHVTVSNTCLMGSRSLTATVSARTRTTSTQFEILEDKNKTEKMNDGNFKGDCSVSVSRGSTRYAFKGSCVKFIGERAGEEMILVPAGQRPGSRQSQPLPGGPQPPTTPPGGGFPPELPPGGPGMPPGPMPMPPAPAPQPVPPAPSQGWACIAENAFTHAVFMGHGPSEFAAKSRAKQNCTNGKDPAYCYEHTIRCAQQELSREAWFCEAKNSFTRRIYNGVGPSQVEAEHSARKSCLDTEGASNAAYCAKAHAVACVKQ